MAEKHLAREHSPVGDDPQILLETANFSARTDRWHKEFHNPQSLGVYVTGACFDGVALCPHGLFKDVDTVASAVESSYSPLVIGSLQQSRVGFNVTQGAPNSEEEQIVRRYTNATQKNFYGAIHCHIFLNFKKR